MLKLNQLKIVSLSLLLLAPFSIWSMEGGEPIEESVTLVAGDESTFNLVPEIVKLSGTIQDYLKDAKEAGIEEAQMPIPAAKATTLALFTKLASDIQQAINQEKDSDKALDQKIQAPSGHIFAKNLQPVVNAALQNQNLSTLEELLKLTHFLDMPTLEDTIAYAYTAKARKDGYAPNEEEYQKWINAREFASPTKPALTKYWYFVSSMPKIEEWLSIKDLMQVETIKPVQDPKSNLLTLDLSEKKLTSLDGLYEIPDIEKVQKINFHFSRFKTLPDNIFNDLAALQSLDLSTASLAILPENIFNKLTHLKYLSLKNNQRLGTIPENIFNNLTALENLNLSDSQLLVLPKGIFKNLAQLKLLNLSQNGFTTLPEDIFEGLTALEYLDLSHNDSLSMLPENIFDNLTALKQLNLPSKLSPEEVEKIRAKLKEIAPNAKVNF